MNYRMTEADLVHEQRQMILQVANKLRIEDPELWDNDELYEEIENRNTHLFTLLNDFVDANKAYFEYHQTIGTASNEEEKEELQRLIDEKNTARNSLLDALDDTKHDETEIDEERNYDDLSSEIAFKSNDNES